MLERDPKGEGGPGREDAAAAKGPGDSEGAGGCEADPESASPAPCPEGRARLVVATTHLLFNPKRGDVKMAQSMLLTGRVERYAAGRVCAVLSGLVVELPGAGKAERSDACRVRMRRPMSSDSGFPPSSRVHILSTFLSATVARPGSGAS